VSALLARRPSPAMVVACLALLVALGGTGIAAVDALAPNSIGSAQLKRGSVTTPKLASGAVTSAKILNGSLLKADFAPDQVPAGPPGPAGAQGPAGVIGAITVRTASVVVPGGTTNAAYSTRAVQKTCDPGEKAISAGTSWSDEANDLELTTVWIKPVLDSSSAIVGFSGKGGNDSGNTSTFTLHVLCYKG
jgi:hypothetical protein